MLRFASAARSHVGLVRDGNEDAGFAGPYLQLVADGVGGCAAGEVASATAAYVVSAMVAGAAATDLDDLLAEAVDEAHRLLRQGVAERPDRAGMATTLTAVVADGDRFALAHIGDSRAYLLRDGRLARLTSDHTFVQALVTAGRLDPAEVAGHPYRSVVLKSLDADHRPAPDVEGVDLRCGDRLLLCSDGLTDFVPEEQVAELLLIDDSDEAADALVAAALEAGGRDNVTCLVADVVDGPRIRPDGALLGALRDPGLVVAAAAVHVPHRA